MFVVLLNKTNLKLISASGSVILEAEKPVKEVVKREVGTVITPIEPKKKINTGKVCKTSRSRNRSKKQKVRVSISKFKG